jgi:2-polyprenyl-3-methyl-5-hydroxy-6-metoxy-1,4-benzoquinol methylase
LKIRWRIAQAFELLWWQRYLHTKDEKSYLIWKKNYWINFLNEIKDFCQTDENSKILDLGCGPAGIYLVFDKNEIDAVDPLINLYEEKIPHFKKANFPQVHFFCDSIENFTSSKNYATIFCINAINHVSDIEQAVKNLSTLADANTKIIVSIDSHKYTLLQKIFSWIPGDILHPHQYTLEGYKNLFQKHGFEIHFEKKLKSEMIFDYWVLGMRKSNYSPKNK